MKALGLGCIAPNYRLVLQIKLQLSLTQGIALDEHLPEKPQYSPQVAMLKIVLME